MKKFFILFLLLNCIFILPVFADDYANKDNLKDHVDASYYCYYNSTGVKSAEYNVIVGISGNYENVYADIGSGDNSVSGPGTEPIANWKYDDENWDSDLDSSYSAREYYIDNGKCPEIAYIHYYPIAYTLYLIPNYQKLEDLKSTFSYNSAEDNEDAYYLVNMDDSIEADKTCSYEATVKKVTGSDTTKDISFTLKYNKEGKIINNGNIGNNVLIAPEIGSSYKYVGEHCPNMYICEVPSGNCAGAGGNYVCDYEYWLYYADYGVDDRYSCQSINCTNSNDEYCDPSSDDSNICVAYTDLYDELSSNFELYKSDSMNFSKYKNSKDRINSWCRNVFANLDFGNPCLAKCFTLEETITNLENQKQSDDNDCNFSQRLIGIIGGILKWIKYILPVIVIVLGILDFIKAIGSDKDDEMKKAQGKFIKRLISAALVFIIPLILEFVLSKMGFGYNECGLFD